MKPYSLKIKEMISDLTSEARAAISSGEEVVYEEVLNNLVIFHISLINAGKYINERGQVDNYALVPAGNGLFAHEVHQEWTLCYQNLIIEVVSQLSRNRSYFERMSYVPGHLFSGMYEIKNPKILNNIIQLQSSLFYHLELWWVKTIEDQQRLDHNMCSPASLSPPFYSVYDSALKTFIGAWEQLKNFYFPPTEISNNPNWDELRAIFPYYETHLYETVIYLFRSVISGDQEAALWLLDVLLRWPSDHKYRFHESYNLIRHTRMLTIDLFENDWTEVNNKIDTYSEGVRKAEALNCPPLFRQLC